QKIAGGVPLSRLKAVPRFAEWTIIWEEASLLERGFLILCLTWPFPGFFWLLLLIPRRTLFFLATSHDFWLVAAAVLLILFGAAALWLWALAAPPRLRYPVFDLDLPCPAYCPGARFREKLGTIFPDAALRAGDGGDEARGADGMASGYRGSVVGSLGRL